MERRWWISLLIVMNLCVGSSGKVCRRIMDCISERAMLIKETAERKFAEKEYIEAKKLAQQAKDLFPGLGFISLFITVIDIYLSRTKIIDGQPDWHAVLGLDNTATLKKTCVILLSRFRLGRTQRVQEQCLILRGGKRMWFLH
ncbi:hypothetical protein Hdeb2414_s0016g00484011 [Helianthus debilis subsp. tardiflorus]